MGLDDFLASCADPFFHLALERRACKSRAFVDVRMKGRMSVGRILRTTLLAWADVAAAADVVDAVAVAVAAAAVVAAIVASCSRALVRTALLEKQPATDDLTSCMARGPLPWMHGSW